MYQATRGRHCHHLFIQHRDSELRVLKNGAGTRRRRENERIFVVVQSAEASKGSLRQNGRKEATIASTRTNRKWRAPSRPHTSKCLQRGMFYLQYTTLHYQYIILRGVELIVAM